MVERGTFRLHSFLTPPVTAGHYQLRGTIPIPELPVDERVDEVAPFLVYQRTASFDTSRRPMLIEWSLAKDGAVTGFVLRPVPDENR